MTIGAKSVTPARRPVASARPLTELIRGVPSPDELLDAADNIRVVHRRGRFSREELALLLEQLAHGASDRKIIRLFKRRFRRSISTHTIDSYRRKYAGRIADIARHLDSLAIEAGLTKRSTRLIRLQELAEAIGDLIFDEDGNIRPDTSAKTIAEYRAVLAQIGSETGDLSMATQGDINFIGVSDEELKRLVANKLAANKDLAVTLAERAGVRPSGPEIKHDENQSN